MIWRYLDLPRIRGCSLHATGQQGATKFRTRNSETFGALDWERSRMTILQRMVSRSRQRLLVIALEPAQVCTNQALLTISINNVVLPITHDEHTALDSLSHGDGDSSVSSDATHGRWAYMYAVPCDPSLHIQSLAA
ncbi:hypothetical protein EV126DRAFT_405848 [Verticillium dahliae]|nr:hypothetical protein EV126DRAFT_405848 [Verticillium dahliae]